MDIRTRADLEHIISNFYETILVDKEIGYIFTDVAKLDLIKHLPRIVDFWESVLFGTGKYQGNPVLNHVHLNKKSSLTKAHFNRWLEIWSNIVDSHYNGDKATEAITKAKMMADLMLFKITASEDNRFVQ